MHNLNTHLLFGGAKTASFCAYQLYHMTAGRLLGGIQCTKFASFVGGEHDVTTELTRTDMDILRNQYATGHGADGVCNIGVFRYQGDRSEFSACIGQEGLYGGPDSNDGAHLLPDKTEVTRIATGIDDKVEEGMIIVELSRGHPFTHVIAG